MDSSHYSFVGVRVVYQASKQQPSSLYWLPDTFWNMFCFFFFLRATQSREERKEGKTAEALLFVSGLCRWSHAPSAHTVLLLTHLCTYTLSQANSNTQGCLSQWEIYVYPIRVAYSLSCCHLVQLVVFTLSRPTHHCFLIVSKNSSPRPQMLPCGCAANVLHVKEHFHVMSSSVSLFH